MKYEISKEELEFRHDENKALQDVFSHLPVYSTNFQ